jgi:predicted enzyme related to lactoylglutathione lyase
VLIDWEQAGIARAFEIQVPNVALAKAFYGKVFGAREVSRQTADGGRLVRLSLAFGRLEFSISSEKTSDPERPALSMLAEDLGVPFIAIMLHVEDLERMAYDAERLGSEVSAPHISGDIIVVTDPFGSHWVLKRREPAEEAGFPFLRPGNNAKTRH